jgi:hypothetical protein
VEVESVVPVALALAGNALRPATDKHATAEASSRRSRIRRAKNEYEIDTALILST